MAQGGAPRPTNPNTPYQRGGWPVGCTSAQPQTKAPPEGRGFRQQGPACEGVAGTMAGPPPENAEPESWCTDCRPRGFNLPGGLLHGGGGLAGTSTRIRVVGPSCRLPKPEQSVGWRFFHERYPNMETSMSIRTIFALTLFAAVAISSAALAQGGGGGGGGAGGGGAGGASSGAAGGASGAGGAAGTTGGATTGGRPQCGNNDW